MELLMDFKFWFGMINLILTFGLIVFNVFAHQKLTTNDLHHVNLDLQEIKGSLASLNTKVSEMDKKVAVLETRVHKSF